MTRRESLGRRRRWSLLLALACAHVVGLAVASLTPPELQAQIAPDSGAIRPTADLPRVTFEKHVLPNGLQLILHVDRKLPIVHVNQWFHVGSKDERVGRSGFAHLFEHMMFQGSENARDEYFSYLERAGANLFEGGVNGTTDWDRTNYFATLPSGNLEYLLWLESDRLATMPNALTEEKLQNQRDVVKNERRQGLENVPYGRSWTLMMEGLFPYRHPYANDVIGTHEDLSAASLEDVREFFRTYYTPNNMSLVIAGDFDPAEARRLAEKYFGPIPAGPALHRADRWPAELDGERIVEVNDRVPQERTYFVWIKPAYFEPGDAEFDLLNLILTDGLSSRLQKALVYERRLCSEVSSFNLPLEAAGVFVLWATARPGASLTEVERVVTEEITRLAKAGPTQEELERAKAKWEYTYVTGLERIGGFGGKADLLNQYNTYFGDPDKFDEDLLRHREVTVAAVREATRRWLDTRDRLLIRFHPDTSSSAASIALDRSSVPDLGADRPFQVPAGSPARLENGLEVLVVERRELPKVAVTLVSRAGSVADPSGQEGLATLTTETMKIGTRTRDALEVQDAFGDLGASLSDSTDREHATLSFEVLSRNLEPAFTILSDVVREPTFPAEDVDLERNRLLDALRQEEQDPFGLLPRLTAMLAFGRDHPYGRPRRGTAESLPRLTRDQLAGFHAARWTPANSALILVGDIGASDGVALATQFFGDWTGARPPPIAIPDPRPPGPGKVFLVDRPQAAQTVVAVVLPGPPRASEDYHALRVADAVWGGGFQSRLNLNLREEKGYSYGVFSQPILRSHSGYWLAGGGVQTDKTRESLVEFTKELKGFAGGEPITEAEQSDARAYRIRGYAQQFETLARIAEQIAELWTVGLPMEELQREPEAIGRTTLESVNAVARKYAAPDGATLLLIGDLSAVGAGVREVAEGEVEILDVNGDPVSATAAAGARERP